METKVCRKCGHKKPVEMFAKNKTKKDGLSNWCKACNSLYKAQYRAEHAEEIRIAKKKCYEAKKEQYLQHHKENYYKHQKERIAYSIKWGKENRERRNEVARKYRAENLEIFREKERVYRETHHDVIQRRSRKHAWEVKQPYCKEIEKIENYNLAKVDNFVGWDRHHRLETHNSDGVRRLVDLSIAELKALDMYYNRPPEELIWLRNSEHSKLHMKKTK